ncbi:MAG: dihydrofolate reductase family protein [Alphaproteobacteria bacterium]|nr:dihydrofolate reductase [Rhizobiaceae bacterium]MBU3959526.1 dihydrofolate reductase family protein [Alphaproteobacteria bacterium]MBU4051206.1 dihydrofolate reductase family protein [Alphaproteobacteria bacterium]MBU4088591.1 dihydrofolate reductase family protein [Alphaproteobacteria bacterium]MBU4155962.1 dihydrofolate reductase family protein [Alphaproteobacteria bacterium]
MAKIVGYIAASLDGYIAAEDDSLDWLFEYDGMDLGEHDYRTFINGIRTVVMGRGTYDFLARNPSPWAYGEQRAIVVTSRPIDDPKGPLQTRSDVPALIEELRSLDDGDVWMLGGGQLQMAFMENGALDEIEIYVIPELLGGGRPLFPATGFRTSPKLISAKAMDRGCVRLHYALTDRPA